MSIIVHQPEIKTTNGKSVLSAKVECSNTTLTLPERLWFSVPEEDERHLTTRADPFLIGLILPAMVFNQTLKIRGEVSPRIAKNIDQFQAIKNTWKSIYNPINIKLDNIVPPPIRDRKGIATAFSGGIDSSYTLWSHLAENENNIDKQITHGIFVHGFDIFLYNQQRYQNTLKQYQKSFQSLNLNLLSISTNLYSFSELKIPWLRVHTGAIKAVGLVYEPLLKQFYRPGGHISKYYFSPHFWTHPLVSTETMSISLHPESKTRIDKLINLENWKFIQQNIRVCQNQKRTDNQIHCFKCSKCLNTLMYLEIIGAKSKFPTFAHKKILPINFLLFTLISSDSYKSNMKSTLSTAKIYKRWNLIFFYYLFYPINRMIVYIYNVIKTIIPNNLWVKIKLRVYRKNKYLSKNKI